MTGISVAVLLLVELPLLVIWGFVLVDVLRQPAMPWWRKTLWILACSSIWPVQVVYLLVRPQRSRVEVTGPRTDPHARLVDAALAHEDGLLDDARFKRLAQRLRDEGLVR